MIKIGIIGISGRMGSAISKVVKNSDEMIVVGGISSQTSCEIWKVVLESDVIVDFSSPSSTIMAIEAASNRGVPVVSGTSGLSQEDLDKIHKCGGKIPILLESNFSIGVQLMAMFIRKCAAVLPNYDCCLIDKHHNKKKDSPSGTAIFFSQQYQEIAQNQKTPQIASIRAGSICGDHICDFAGEDEVLTISHRAINREVFAKGAIHCARWILGKPPKATLYRMMDYLDDEKSKQKYGK